MISVVEEMKLFMGSHADLDNFFWGLERKSLWLIFIEILPQSFSFTGRGGVRNANFRISLTLEFRYRAIVWMITFQLVFGLSTVRQSGLLDKFIQTRILDPKVSILEFVVLTVRSD